MTIPVIKSCAQLEEFRRGLPTGLKLGLVPTMGALHAGHLSLVETAKNHCDQVLVSVFLNPAQFGKGEDLASYPRQLGQDVQLLESVGAMAVYAPEPRDIYPEGFQTWVYNSGMSLGLCGAARPGHFQGVCTVVLKLFNLIQPDIAVFGKKDYQQLLVIRQMVSDLSLRIKVISSPLVRDVDGLALSSRNAYLSDEQRAKSLWLSRSLFAVKEKFLGGCQQVEELIRYGRGLCEQEGGLETEYYQMLRGDNLKPVQDPVSEPAVLIAAVRMGNVRLLDNLEIHG